MNINFVILTGEFLNSRAKSPAALAKNARRYVKDETSCPMILSVGVEDWNLLVLCILGKANFR